MKKVLNNFLCCSLAILFCGSCNKSDDNNNSADNCNAKGFGVLQVNFGASGARHSIIVTPAGSTSAREKLSSKGVMSDTMHLAPGSYTASISSVNDGGQSIDVSNKSAIITKCDVSIFSVSF